MQTVAPDLELAPKPTVSWINVDGLQPIQAIEHLGERFSLLPLVLEDILNTARNALPFTPIS